MDAYTTSRVRRYKRRDPLAVLFALVPLLGLPIAGYAAWYFLVKNPPSAPQVPQAVATTAASGRAAQQDVQPRPAPPAPPRAAAAQPSPDDDAVPALASLHVQGPARDVAGAVDRVVKQVHDSLALGKKNLLVWIVDRSASNEGRRQELVDRFGTLYRSLEAAARSAATGDDPAVLSAVVSYSSEHAFLNDEPTADTQALVSALESIQTDKSGHVENTFAAIKAATEKYLPLRVQQGRYVTLVVVSDEVGDDQQLIDDVLVPLKKYAVPVHVIGVSAPFARLEGGNLEAEGTHQNLVAGLMIGPRVQQGPDSRDPQWPLIGYPMGGAYEAPAIETGIGPYSLARLCRETGGTYHAISVEGGLARVGGGQGGSSGGFDRQAQTGAAGTEYWAATAATGAALPSFNVASVPTTGNFIDRFPPRYMPEAQYRQELAANKAKSALVDAARLPPAESLGSVPTSFTPAEGNDAQMSRTLEMAQRPAARIMQAIDRMYDVLRAGEADAARLTDEDARWKAGYYTALGRIMAAKVRCEGYINILAVLKSGRKFDSESSTTWVVEPADELTVSSTLDKMSQKSREYLKLVIDNYPGTPWADAAMRELSVPVGWKLTER